MMNRNLLASCAVILLMNLIHASGDERISYKTIRVDDVDVFYRETGPANGPTVLLLHGFPSSSRMFEPLLSALSGSYHLIAPDYPGFGHSSWPDHQKFAYTFDHLAEIMERFADRLHLRSYTLVMQDYGGPVGFRMAVAHPERIEAMIIQNAASHEEGLSPLWVVRREYWKDRAKHEAALRANFLSLEATRQRHVGASPNLERINPDTWMDEYYFLNQPGQADILSDLFFDYQTNVRSYPVWQKWLQANKPPLLVLWGRFDPSFLVNEAEAYRKDVPDAEVHVLDAGHFAMDERPEEVIRLVKTFLDQRRRK